MRKLLFIIPILLLSLTVSGQRIGAGGSAMWNFQTESMGLGARVNFGPNNAISYVPQFTYYSIIGSISEWMIGLQIEAKVIRGNTFNWYLAVHGAYDHWSNPNTTIMEDAQTSNWNLEGGAGITTNWCLRPFLEYRYNIKFQETHLRLGLLYVFGCESGRGDGYRDQRRMKNMTICP